MRGWLAMYSFFLLTTLCISIGTYNAITEAFASPATTVYVRREYCLPKIETTKDARKAWLDFVWEKGGGLPLLGVIQRERSSSTSNLETTMQRRMLLPILMEEQLETQDIGSSVVDNATLQLDYRVVNGGLLSTEIVPNSHRGTIVFEANTDGGVLMVWTVSFETTVPNRTPIWQAVTERTITDTCGNFQRAMDDPVLYERVTFLTSDESHPFTPADAKAKWIEFCWKQGAGFPLPFSPLLLGDTRWIIPPFLKEKLVQQSNSNGSDRGTDYAEIQYQVENPGLFTYQVFSHRGRINFYQESDNTVRMEWKVEIRPYAGWDWAVKAFTASVISCYCRNFKCHIQDGKDSWISLPLSSQDGMVDGLRIRKDSWIGGVVQASIADNRQFLARLFDAFRPWTWGRARAFDEEGEYERWTA